MESDPSRPLQLAFGSKSDQNDNCSQYSTLSQGGKQSIATVPVHLKAISDKPAAATGKIKDISPIEVFSTPNSIMVWRRKFKLVELLDVIFKFYMAHCFQCNNNMRH